MPVITTAEVKTLLGITASTWDSVITTMIPLTQGRLALLCNQYFIIEDLYWQGAVTFAAGTMVLDTTDDIESVVGFADGDEFLIHNSYRNDGYKVSASVTDQTITLASGYTATAELSGASVFLSPTYWPESIKPIVSQMVFYDYNERPKAMGEIAKRLGPYNVSYSVTLLQGQGYPQNIIAALSGGGWVMANIV